MADSTRKSRHRIFDLRGLLSPASLFILIASVFGLIFVKITPPLWGFDETSHFARVYQLEHGQILPHMMPNDYGGQIPSNLYDLINYTKSDLLDNTVSVNNLSESGNYSRKDITNINGYARFTHQRFSVNQHGYLWTAFYSPVAYVAPTLGVFITNIFHSSIGATITAARIFSLAFYIVIVWFSIKLLGKSKLRWLIFTVALLPTSLFQASMVTADNTAIALSILLFALVIRILQSKSPNSDRRLIYALAAIAILLPLVKINYIFLSLALLIIPKRFFKTQKLAVAFKASWIIVVTCLALIWSVMAKVGNSPPIPQRPDGIKIIPSDQIQFMLHHPLHMPVIFARSLAVGMDSYIQSMISLIGWNFVSISIAFIFLLCFGIIFSGLYAKDELAPIRRSLLFFGILAVSGVVSIFAALYVGFTPTGHRVVDGVQGRYFLPFLVPLVVGVLAFVPIEIKIKPRQVPYIFGAISSLGLIASVIYYYLATY